MTRKILAALAGIAIALLVGPRLLDRTPPQVTEEIWRIADPALPGLTKVSMGAAPSVPLRGNPNLDVRIQDHFPGGLTTLEVDGVPQQFTVEEGGRILRSQLDLEGLTDGQHMVTLTLRDRAWPANRAQMSRMLMVDTTPPSLTLAASSRQVAQGRTYAVFARASEPIADPVVELDGTKLPAAVLDDAATLRALTGIGVKAEPGEKTLVIEARDEAGNVGRWEGLVTILDTEFPFGGYIQLSPKKQDDMLDKEKGKEANKKRGAAYDRKVGRPVPDQLFVTPVDGRLTSPFGKVRKYNTGIERHHLGTDLAAPSGTPVRSAGPGVVVLAELLHIYGNAVIVNHADGVSTSYNHLSAIDVKVGDVVAAGDVVGKVGSTGQSTGPHLHWGMVVQGEAVAAEEWTQRRFDVPQSGDFGE
jgi:murein DD-endopeptidase MepM/ murein hydrolase activator NlpD